MATASVRNAHIPATLIPWRAVAGTLAASNLESLGLLRGSAVLRQLLANMLVFIAIQTTISLTVENAQARVADITDVAASGVRETHLGQK
jgi:hypothetical protein